MKPKHEVFRGMRPMERNAHNKEDVLSLQKSEWKIENSSRTSSYRNSPYDSKHWYDMNESESANMPVIVNVFSLSQASNSNTNELFTRNISQKNNFLVTPPCSPPLALLGLFGTTSVISENYGPYDENRTSLPRDISSGSTNSTDNNDASDHHQMYYPVEKIANGFIGQCLQPQKHTTEYQPNAKTIQYRPNDKNDYLPLSDNISYRYAKYPIAHPNKYLTHKGSNDPHVSPGINVSFKRQRGQCGSKRKISARRQYVFKKLIQHIQRNQNAKSKSSNRVNQQELQITSEHNKQSCRTSSNGMDKHRYNNQDIEQSFGKYNTPKRQYSEILSGIPLTTKLSRTATHSLSETAVEYRNIFLSPPEVKVLQLKKRLQEQGLA